MSTSALNTSELVLQRVAHRTGKRVHDLAVEVGAGLVVLRGRARSYHVKQLAQTGAQEAVPNVRLENAIIVE